YPRRAERARRARDQRPRLCPRRGRQPARGDRRRPPRRPDHRRALPRPPARGRAMNLQFVADGLLVGAMIGLGAIGVTLTYSILRFANFAHGEFIAWGAYAALTIA